MLKPLRGVVGLLARLRKSRSWAEVRRKMPAFDLEVYDIADLWLDMPLAEKAGAEQLPHDLFKPAVR